jgi:hypothetical protein
VLSAGLRALRWLGELPFEGRAKINESRARNWNPFSLSRLATVNLAVKAA